MTAGSGHRRAAEAVAEAVRQRDPKAAVRCEDFLALTPSWWRTAYPRVYRRFVTHMPWAWGWLYHVLDQAWVFACYQPLRRRWNRWVARAFLRQLITQQPDVVIVTHFLPADVVTWAKRAGLIRARVITVVTDFYPHRMWMVQEADEVVVGIEETAQVCRRLGVRPERVHVYGIPMSRQFVMTADRSRWFQTLQLDPARKTVLVTSGGMGVGPLEQLAQGLMALERSAPGRLQLIIVCGDNQPLVDRLKRLSQQAAMPIRVFGFVETMGELMHISDVIITKPGGLTVVESLAVGIPMILCGAIPGQERANADYLVRQGAGVNAEDASRAVALLEELVAHPARLEEMRARAKALGKPQAAARIVEELLAGAGHG